MKYLRAIAIGLFFYLAAVGALFLLLLPVIRHCR